MSRIGFLALSLGLAGAVSAAPQPLRLNLKSAAMVGYRVAMEQATYPGGGTKASEQSSLLTPYKFRGTAPGSLEITSGPLVVKGRSVGRSKVSSVMVEAGGTVQGRAPANFFVCLPKAGAKVGQTWRAPFFGGPPLPAGGEAVYRYGGVSSDGRFAVVDLQVKSSGAGEVQGKGKLFLRLSDGVLDHGNAKFEIAYLRPDMKDRTKISVNSKVVVKYTITAG